MRALIFIWALFASTAIAGTFSPVVTCNLGQGKKISLMAESHSVEGKELYLRIGKKTQAAFQDMPNERFIGEIAFARCVNKVLVFAMNYGPPYFKGAAIRKNPKTNAIETLYFSEKLLPSMIYTNADQMLVVIPNGGNETEKRFLVYRSLGEKGQDEQSEPVDALPDETGFSVIHLAH